MAFLSVSFLKKSTRRKKMSKFKVGDIVKCKVKGFACYGKLAKVLKVESEHRQYTVGFMDDGGRGLLFDNELVLVRAGSES